MVKSDTSIKITSMQSVIAIPNVSPSMLQAEGLTVIGSLSTEKVQILVESTGNND
jgi:hypothetical protein